MTETITRRVSQKDNRASFTLHRRQPSTGLSHAKVCKFWLAGNCRKNPCRFTHHDISAPIYSVLRAHSSSKQSHEPYRQLKVKHTRESEEVCNNFKRKQKTSSENVVEGCDFVETGNSVHPKVAPNASEGDVQRTQRTKVCEYWVKNSCVHGTKCKFLHSWCYGYGFSMLAQLQGHKKAVTGITLPSGSDKLFSGSKDGTVRVWNCHSGECIGVADVGASVECLISEGQWVFAGLTNAIKAWDISTNAEFTLSGPAGQVYAMAAANEMLFAWSSANDLSLSNTLKWMVREVKDAMERLAETSHSAKECAHYTPEKLKGKSTSNYYGKNLGTNNLKSPQTLPHDSEEALESTPSHTHSSYATATNLKGNPVQKDSLKSHVHRCIDFSEPLTSKLGPVYVC